LKFDEYRNTESTELTKSFVPFVPLVFQRFLSLSRRKEEPKPSCAFMHVVRNQREFAEFERKFASEQRAQRKFEEFLWDHRPEFTMQGFCAGCQTVVPLKVDLKWGNGVTPNWRERLECPCGLNNRIRGAFDFLAELTYRTRRPRLYATEQVTAFFRELKKRHPSAIGSEFLRDNTARGNTNKAGIRHEDITALTFRDRSFDVVLSFDILEHVPDFRAAFRELARVLVPGGHLLASFPFDSHFEKTQIRASIGIDGSISHHLPAEYHGDPVDGAGCLCFQVYGWDVLEELKQAGFRDAWTVHYWSAERGYLGGQLLFIARK